ncbi:MAG: DUF6440 family protein [Propionibacteriaceae bacterium]|nr:DUF6440 family protein [Propionibacteriaceae bacterium]
MAKKEERFQVVHEDKSLESANRVLRDRETGVLYLFRIEGYGGGLTVLVDRDGKPLVQTYDKS